MTCSKVECNPSKCSRTFLFQPFLTYPPSLIWVLVILLCLDLLLLLFSPPSDWCIAPQKSEWCMDLLRAGCQDKAISLSQPWLHIWGTVKLPGKLFILCSPATNGDAKSSWSLNMERSIGDVQAPGACLLFVRGWTRRVEPEPSAVTTDVTGILLF